MALFEYQVKTAAGRPIKGKLTATDKPAAMDELRKRNLTVFSLVERKTSILQMDIYIGNPVKTIHFIIYCRQFATLMRAGVSIVDATRILAEQTDSKPLRKALQDVGSSLLRGISFSQAVQDHKRIFPPLFVSMIRAGEESGNMEGTLERLAMFLKSSIQQPRR